MKRKLAEPTANDDQRARLALHCAYSMMAAARAPQTFVDYRNNGGFELEDFFDGIERGIPKHPLLRQFLRRLSENRNRPPPSLSDMLLRRHVIRCVAALEKNGLKPGKARAFASEHLARTFREYEVQAIAPSDSAIRHYQEGQVLGAPEDDLMIANAIKSARGSNERLVEYFAGVIIFGHEPTVPVQLSFE
jgi:hypothetical protein